MRTHKRQLHCNGMFIVSVVVAIVMAIATPGFSQEDPKTSALNTVFFELAGNGGFCSLNYEYQLSKTISARIGAGLGLPIPDPDFGIFSFPVMITYLRGAGNHKLEIGGGVTMFYGNFEFELFDEEHKIEGSAPAVTGSLGYRYYPVKGGLSFRAAFTPFVVDGTFCPSAGVSVGYRF